MVGLSEGSEDGIAVGLKLGLGEGTEDGVTESGSGQVVSPHPQFAPLVQTLLPVLKALLLCHLQ